MAPRGNMDGQPRTGPGAGLRNMGNTCFLNAVLQCLTYTPPLANYLLSGEHSLSCNRPDGCVMCRMQQHMHNVLNPTDVAIVPLDIMTVLPLIGDHFKLGMQEDAHEFLRCVLEAMHSACLPEFGLNVSLPQTAIHQIFGSFMRSRVFCSGCQVVSDTYEPFLDIFLDIKVDSSVIKALESFVKPELMDAGSGFRCRQCGQMAGGSKRMTIHWAPQVLTLCLKRFDDFAGGKISKFVNYPEILDLEPYMSEAVEQEIYSLYAVLVHSGDTCHSGHYFCYIKANDGQWYKMDDSFVTGCIIDTVLTQEAYLLFYLRISDLKTESMASTPTAPPQTDSSLPLSLSVSKQDMSVKRSPQEMQDSLSPIPDTTGQTPQQSRVSARASTRQSSQQRIASAPGVTSEQSLPSDPLRTSSTGQKILPSDPLRTSSTGQKILPSDPSRASSTMQQILPSDPSRASSTRQQILPSDPLRTSSTGQKILPSDPSRASSTWHQILPSDPSRASSTWHQILPSDPSRTSSTGQQFPQSALFRTSSTGQQFPQSSSFGRATPGQQLLQSSSFGTPAAAQPSWGGSWQTSSGWPSSRWPAWFSNTSSVSRREWDSLVPIQPHPHSRGWPSSGPAFQFQSISRYCLLCTRERHWPIHIEPFHHMLPARQADRNRRLHGFFPSCSFYGSSAREGTQSRSPQLRGGESYSELVVRTDYDSSAGKRMRTAPPSCDSAPRAEAALVPPNTSSIRAPPPTAAQEKTPSRKREWSRSPLRTYDLRSRSLVLTDSAGKKRWRRNSSSKRKKLERRLRGRRR
ncbi:ubiquitin carboxyl-terminal hydrolase 36-like [Heliangelus exortis]|uniref:ubiquitin carboxyl-terminal hydrolase 36-like n=1 Tax=Heliangelus exortis TaxID=472823 RepID=UPI003A8CF1F6